MRRIPCGIFCLTLCALFTLSFMATTPSAQQSDDAIVVRGATTVAQLIDPWAKEFQQSDKKASVVIFGSTHGDGISALVEGKAHVAMLARGLSPEEQDKLTNSGVRFATQFLCYDAVAIVVHPANPVRELSIDQLRKMFSGEVTNWGQLGGSDLPLEVVDLPGESGMRSFLSKDVLGVAFLPKPAVVASPNKVPDEVGRRKGGIGFCRTQLALSSEKSDRIKPLAIKSQASGDPIPLTLDNVRSKAYPIMRSLYLCYDETKASDSARRYVEYCASKMADKVAAGK